jgi:hypothetical protein
MRIPTRFLSVLLCAFAFLLPLRSVAQTPASPSSGNLLTQPQLDQLVSPIALYPDALLSQVLMAATYPLEVVSADRWVSKNKELKGDKLKTEAQKQGWDASVTALTATPDVLGMMSTQLDWTQKLGDAVLAQQPDVMDAIQRLRTKAYDNKKLTSTKQQTVSVKKDQGRDVVIIEPAEPDTVYVPYYDPGVVYGAWPYPEYQPYVWPYPGYIAGGVIATGIAFGAGYALGRWTSGGNYWGGSFNWGNNNININRPIDIDKTKINNFTHNPEHRHGVKYRNDSVQQKFGNRTTGAGSRDLDFRGRDGQQVLKPDRDGPGGRDRPAADTRPGGKDRPDAGKRPGGGDRPGAGQRPAGDKKTASRPDVKRPQTADRPRPQADRPRPQPHGGGRDGAFSHIDRGGAAARAHASRGHASLGGGGHAQIRAHPGGGRGGGAARGGGGRRR